MKRSKPTKSPKQQAVSKKAEAWKGLWKEPSQWKNKSQNPHKCHLTENFHFWETLAPNSTKNEASPKFCAIYMPPLGLKQLLYILCNFIFPTSLWWCHYYSYFIDKNAESQTRVTYPRPQRRLVLELGPQTGSLTSLAEKLVFHLPMLAPLQEGHR